MRISVVTASIGPKERRRKLFTPRYDRRESGVDYVAFADRPVDHPIWRTVQIPTGVDPYMTAKRVKVLIAEYVKADATIWIDRHCRLLCDPATVFDMFPQSVAVVRHLRRCVYREAKVVRESGKDAPEAIRRTVERLQSWQIPKNFGLFFGGFLLRRHPESDEMSQRWWQYIEHGSRRDQLTLPVALDRSGVSVRTYKRKRRPEFFAIGGH